MTRTESPYDYDIAIIGAGWFGARSAISLSKLGLKLALIDAEISPLRRASYVNQSRIHNGYHYPRSLMTALGSHQYYHQFKEDYADCVMDSFSHIYGIAKQRSKCNAFQFEKFCQTVGIPLAPAPKAFWQLANPDMFDDLFLVEEACLDTQKLGIAVAGQLQEIPNLTCYFGLFCRQLEIEECSVSLHLVAPLHQTPWQIRTRCVLIACYGGSNDLLCSSGLTPLHLKGEITEITLVKVPQDFHPYGLTVMDGPFFSCIPFPAKNCWSLTHVRYTPHISWELGQLGDDSDERFYRDYLRQAETRISFMRNDAARFIPCLRQVEYLGSLFELKTVPIKNERDDGRPILLQIHYGQLGDFAKGPCVFSVLGSKLDSVYEWEKQLLSIFS